jgi:DHA1 family inner membrane transport protein
MTATSPPTTAPVGPERTTLRSLDLAVLSVGTFTLGVDGFVLSGLLPQVARSLRVTTSSAGQLTTLFAVLYALSSPLIATVAGHWDRRKLLAAGMSVFVGGMTVQATGADFAAVAAGRVLAALGAAAYQATAYSTAGILSDDEHRARSLAIVAGGSSAALVAGLPFGILIGQLWGWRSAMWILVILGIISAIATGLLPPAHSPAMGLRQRARALTDRRVLGILAGTLTVLTPGFMVIAYLPTILHSAGTPVVIVMLAYGGGQVTGTSLGARLIRRRGARAAFLLGAVGVTLTIAVLAASRHSLPIGGAAMAALGLCVGLTIVPQQHRLFATVPDLAPVAVGLNGSAIYIGTALGAGVGGVALAIAGPVAPAALAAAIGILAIAVGAWVVPERMPPSRRASRLPLGSAPSRPARAVVSKWRFGRCRPGWESGTGSPEGRCSPLRPGSRFR